MYTPEVEDLATVGIEETPECAEVETEDEVRDYPVGAVPDLMAELFPHRSPCEGLSEDELWDR